MLKAPRLGIIDGNDGIHLNDAGHARSFQVAEAIVKPYVCSRVACR